MNVIMIYCDDLGYGDLGCYGSDTVKTPHLDALAADGVRFTDWCSNSPVCSPSRASLMTGRYPQRAGVSTILGGKRGIHGLPADEMTLAKLLNNNGYRTGMFGKWHLGTLAENNPNAHGFEEFFGFLAGCVDYYSHIFYWGQGGGVNPVHDLWENDREVWLNGEYLTHAITGRAVDFIDRHREEPFLLYVPYNAPHYPMHAPQEYMDRYAHLPWDRQVMAAMISAVDDGVGEIVEQLKRHGLYENTLIFFSSDNGPSSETRNWLDGTDDLYYGGSAGLFRGHKGSLFNGGIREPAILTCTSRIQGGRIIDEPCIMMDLFPTVASLCGVELPADRIIDGTDLSGLLCSGMPLPERQVFWAYNGQLAARQGKWKLVLDGKPGMQGTGEPVMLADMLEDPGEWNNLKDQHPDIVERLRESVQDWYMKLHSK